MYSQNSNSEDVINFIHRRKNNLIKVFDSKCCICGFDKFQQALEFHHVNPEEKEFQICGSNAVTKALEKQLIEMRKCILVCANCHRGIHQGYYQVPDNWKSLFNEEIAQQLLDNLKPAEYKCKKCGKNITRWSNGLCKECSHIAQRVCDRPSRKELKDLIRTIPFTQIAKKYCVSDNTIRKWCDAENLPRKVSEIKKYSDEEWEKI